MQWPPEELRSTHLLRIREELNQDSPKEPAVLRSLVGRGRVLLEDISGSAPVPVQIQRCKFHGIDRATVILF